MKKGFLSILNGSDFFAEILEREVASQLRDGKRFIPVISLKTTWLSIQMIDVLFNTK